MLSGCVLALLALTMFGCIGSRVGTAANPVEGATLSPPTGTGADPSTLHATRSVQINVINLTRETPRLVFRFAGIQLIDTIAPAGTLNIPVLRRTLNVAPGTYLVQFLDLRATTLHVDTLTLGLERGREHATIELIFDDDSSRQSICYCVKLYGQ